jgi:hypothetical protein
MTPDEIKDIAEDVIWDALMTGESLTKMLDNKGLTADNRERVEHTIQCANIKVWWDPEFAP